LPTALPSRCSPRRGEAESLCASIPIYLRGAESGAAGESRLTIWRQTGVAVGRPLPKPMSCRGSESPCACRWNSSSRGWTSRESASVCSGSEGSRRVPTGLRSASDDVGEAERPLDRGSPRAMSAARPHRDAVAQLRQHLGVCMLPELSPLPRKPQGAAPTAYLGHRSGRSFPPPWQASSSKARPSRRRVPSCEPSRPWPSSPSAGGRSRNPEALTWAKRAGGRKPLEAVVHTERW
jgi:hypothetical protein